MSDHWMPGHDGVPRQEPPIVYPPEERDRFVTPDGVPLAGWWRRFFAYWVDAILIGICVSLVLLPLQLGRPDVWLGALQSRGAVDSWTAVDGPAIADGVTTALATLVVSALYSILMTSRLGWTLGKRLLGIRVRHRAQERLPTSAEATSRWAVQLAPVAIGSLPWIGAVASLWTLLDGLWPVWDVRRQAIHDRVAQTSVVRA